MKVEHIAIWVENIEAMRQFFLTYFNAISSDKYVNSKKNFTSYFISFNEGGARLELMNNPDIYKAEMDRTLMQGLAHISIFVGTKRDVDELTERLRNGHYRITSEPRTTGDGYYESVILDPEGNSIELTGE
jgi:lactoylglutathione lyase